MWIPKYRKSLLTGQLAIRLKQILYEIANEYGFRIIATEVMPDHVHLLLEAPSKYSPSKIIGLVKGISSRRMRQEFLPIIKRHIWKENTLWARGYYCGTAGHVSQEQVIRYIMEQEGQSEFNYDLHSGIEKELPELKEQKTLEAF